MNDVALIVVGGVVGFAASSAQQWLGHKQARAAERAANQRRILTEVQETLAGLMKATYKWNASFMEAYVAAQGDDYNPFDDDVRAHCRALVTTPFSEGLVDALNHLRRLTPQVADLEAHGDLQGFVEVLAGVPSARELGALRQYLKALDATYASLIERTGRLLREL